jgi:hypothetical protein
LTASKLMVPSRIASSERLGKDLYQPQRLDELAFAAIAHAGF